MITEEEENPNEEYDRLLEEELGNIDQALYEFKRAIRDEMYMRARKGDRGWNHEDKNRFHFKSLESAFKPYPSSSLKPQYLQIGMYAMWLWWNEHQDRV